MKVMVLVMTVTAAAMPLRAQPVDWMFSIALKGNYTTSSKIFNNPDSPSQDLRGEYLPLDNIYGAGVELRFRSPGEDFFLALSVEYLTKQLEQLQTVALANPPRRLPVLDGFALVPAELGVNIFVPLGSEKARLAMGGGLGAYYARRILSVAGVAARQVNRPVAFGIHVESSFDYRVTPHVSLRAEMRFRDPEVTTESRFEKESVEHGGMVIAFPREPIRTKVNVNGLSFGLGVVFEIL